MKLAFYAARKLRAQKAMEELKSRYGACPPEEAEAIVVLGGDGTMLRALHQFVDYQAPLFGLNLGTLGFLLNPYTKEAVTDLPERIEAAQRLKIRPLQMEATDQDGEKHKEVAFNEVSLLRERHNSAKLRITINEQVRLDTLVCDGVILSTPVGSTAYNSSAGGPIVPLDANVLPLTPISTFRPRRWPGALIPNKARVSVEILNPVERPVSATADSTEVRHVREVQIRQSTKISKTLLFDPDNHLEERISQEQFAS